MDAQPTNRPPHAEIALTEGEAEATEMFLRMRLKEAEQRFASHQTAMLVAASDIELCTQLLMKLHGEPTSDRPRFKSSREQLASLAQGQS